MQTVCSRAARLLIFAAYLLATTASGLWHVHHTRRDAAAGGGAGCSGHPSAGNPDAAPWHGPFDPGVCGGQPHVVQSPRVFAGEGCPVCQFLAEKPIPSVPSDELSAACLEQELVPAGRVPGASQRPACYQVRGPPAVA